MTIRPIFSIISVATGGCWGRRWGFDACVASIISIFAIAAKARLGLAFLDIDRLGLCLRFGLSTIVTVRPIFSIISVTTGRGRRRSWDFSPGIASIVSIFAIASKARLRGSFSFRFSFSRNHRAPFNWSRDDRTKGGKGQGQNEVPGPHHVERCRVNEMDRQERVGGSSFQ
jgi:hypothetical protein